MKIRRQKPFPGGRWAMGSCVEPQLKEAVSREARHYKCSKSMVIANCVAFALDIALDESYREPQGKGKILKLRRVK